MSLLSPNVSGKVVLKDGAACTAGNAILPVKQNRQHIAILK